MTRRPASDPDLLVSSVDRDTWQGMANARVPSAFPIDRYRMPDPQRRPPISLNTPPIGLRTWQNSQTTTAQVGPWTRYLGDPPAGCSGGVAILATQDWDTITIPSGWDVMASGTNGTLRYRVIVATSGTFDTEVIYSDHNGRYSSAAQAGMYLIGHRGGSWDVSAGTPVSVGSWQNFADVGDAPIWAQLGAIAGLYTVGSIPALVKRTSNNTCGASVCPHPPGVSNSITPTDFDLAAMTTAMASPKTPGVDIWDYNNIGAAGLPYSVCFAATWRP